MSRPGVKTAIYCCLALGAASGAQSALTKPVLLQTVELEDMSTDGGEAKLYRATTPALAPCRMDVIHYGESGRAGYVFIFGSRLQSATRTEYRYNLPYYMTGGGKVASTHSITLKSAAGRKQLEADFAEYKAKFDPRKLAQCETR